MNGLMKLIVLLVCSTSDFHCSLVKRRSGGREPVTRAGSASGIPTSFVSIFFFFLFLFLIEILYVFEGFMIRLN